ncbi:MAG TPA: carboxypeptidase regulatory-like domain-containing protein [Candidatus Thermoplasmatota archaeon]|nr:carboxypeptidase regulatory-like domain-containing protein [Candidatus Thermoplasmatota archaeon]
MRSTLLGLAVPVLLIAVGFATIVPQAAGQDADVYEISGRVVSDTGDPIEGARVNGYTYADSSDAKRSAYQNADAITDADGHYTLKLAAGKGWINVYYDEWRQGDGRELIVDDDVTDLTFTLKTPPPKNAIIEGVVVDANGDPVEDAQVTLGYACCYAMPVDETVTTEPASDAPAPETNATTSESGSGVSNSSAPSRIAIMPPSYDDWAETTTDKDGAFSFKSYPGPHQITAYAKGFAQETQTVTSKEGETVKVLVKLMKVPPRDAILSGRVVDGATGLPIAGANVNVRSLEWGRYASATTDKDGRYEIKTVRGWTQVDVNFWQCCIEPLAVEDVSSDLIAKPIVRPDQYFPYSTTIKLQSGDNDQDLKIDPKPKPTLALVGYVVDPDAKKGVEGAHVNVWNAETGDWGEAITDKTGSFRILVSPGHYNANAWKDGYLAGAQTFVVTKDEIQRVDLILPKGIQRWAPCEDDDSCGYPMMYAAKGGVAMGDTPYATPPPAAPMQNAPGSQAPMAEGRGVATPEASFDATAPAAGPDTSRAASFSGSGGGLPEYDPDETSGIPAAKSDTASEVPGLGLLALAGVGAAVALAMRSRRKA